jgi:hypothetical protein
MKNYLIRRKIDVGTDNERWVYYQRAFWMESYEIIAKEISLCDLEKGIQTFETYHEATSINSKHLDSRWEVVNVFDILPELIAALKVAQGYVETVRGKLVGEDNKSYTLDTINNALGVKN